jgi:hypothetical protein
VADSMAAGWFYLKSGAPGGQQTGPVTWEQLYGLARSGAVGPQDLVWNPSLPQWLPASQVPGLFAGAAPPAYALPAYAPRGPQPARSSRSSRLLPVLIPVIALILVGGGLGAYFGFSRDSGGTDGGGGSTVSGSTASSSTVNGQTITGAQSADLGTIEITLPDRAKLVESAAWGEVPADRISVMMVQGKMRADAETVAKALGGSVVGELQYLNIYQIQTAGSTEADLAAALDRAATLPGVDLAYPNQQLYVDEEIWGVRQSPLNDPAYGGEYGKGYTLIGAQKAWNYAWGSGLPISPVKVGVVDSGLYEGTGEFGGTTKIEYIDPAAGNLANPAQLNLPGGGTIADPRGGHGTTDAAIIGANPANGGLTGIASPVLGDKLTLAPLNLFSAPYGDYWAFPDPNDPTKYVGTDGWTYVDGGLAALLKEVQSNAKIINCSWGSGKVDEGNAPVAAAYRRFFEKMAKDHPDVLFVCAAGNFSGALSKTNYYPAGAGSGLPNVITVGNVMNDGGEAESSNVAGPDGEVTIAAPGDEAVRGVDANGQPISVGYEVGGYTYGGGGTSSAAPQVASAVTLLLSLNPKLTPQRIKEILVETARPGPEDMGGGILAVDQAVLLVINEVRKDLDLPMLSPEQLEAMAVIDAVATSTDQPGVYSVKGILMAVPDGGTQVTITASGGATVDGDTTQSIAAVGEVEWPMVTVIGGKATITVTRKDSGASSVITWKPPDASPLDGHWEGESLIPEGDGATSYAYELTLDLSSGVGSPGVASVKEEDAWAVWYEEPKCVLEVTEAAGTTTLRITDDYGMVMTGTLTGPDTLEGTTVREAGGETRTWAWHATRTP